MRPTPRIKSGPKLAETEHHRQVIDTRAATRGRTDQWSLIQPNAAPNHFLTRHNDGRPQAGADGVDYGAQGMGQPALWSSNASRCDLHTHLYQATDVAITGTSAVRTYRVLLSNFWRAYFYVECESFSFSFFFPFLLWTILIVFEGKGYHGRHGPE